MPGMADVEATIWDYLGAANIDPPIPISYPGVSFQTKEGPDGQNLPYAEVSFHPNLHQPTGIGFASGMSHRGFVQINVIYPSGDGEILAMIAADNIGKVFARGSSAYSAAHHNTLVTFEDAPDVGAPMTDATEIMVPITVAWRSIDA